MVSNISLAQMSKEEKPIADTVLFITTKINELTSTKYKYEAYKLNFDDCNLEIVQKWVDKETWSMYEFMLPDIDEKVMRLEYVKHLESWKLRLSAIDDKEVIQVGASFGTGYVSSFELSCDEKEPLVEIGQALFFAIKTSRSLDRFKE